MVEIEQKRTIVGFPNYEVTSFGRILNKTRGRELKFQPNPEGIPTVGLYVDGKQNRRSVKVLVAQAFVPGETLIYNSPISKDGDWWNLRAENLMWRPRWFAWRWANQFTDVKPYFSYGPVRDLTNRETYPTIWDASLASGNLCEHIYRNIMDGYPVFPKKERYKALYNVEDTMA